MEIKEVGTVKNQFDQPKGPEEMRGEVSIIEVKSEYEEGLYGIEESNYLQILFDIHRSEGYDLISPRRHGKERGVFASRSPRRPSSLGATVVELLEREDNELRVKGLDAINGTPVVDIKPYAAPFDSADKADIEKREQPRQLIQELIKSDSRERLLKKAGQLHGHYCPFLALGVLAGKYAISHLGSGIDGMEDTVAIVETNSCFSDGIQYVTGCTFGNNGLIYKDYGKTAVTVATREGQGIRLYLNREDLLEEDYPEGRELFEKVVKERNGTEKEEEKLKKIWRDIGFDLVTRSAEELFKIGKIDSPDIPDYAPIYEDEYCDNCDEKFMEPKGLEVEEKNLCRDCATEGYFQLDGSGLSKVTS